MGRLRCASVHGPARLRDDLRNGEIFYGFGEAIVLESRGQEDSAPASHRPMPQPGPLKPFALSISAAAALGMLSKREFKRVANRPCKAGSGNDVFHLQGGGTIDLRRGNDTLTTFEGVTVCMGAALNTFDRINGGNSGLLRLSGDCSAGSYSIPTRLSGSTRSTALPASAARCSRTAPPGSPATSTGSAPDTLEFVNFNTDLFNVSGVGAVTGIDAAVTSGALSSSTFDSNLAAAIGAGHLAAHHAVLFTATSGTLSGHTIPVVDENGVAGCQAGGDLVMDVTGATGTLTMSDFI